MNERLKSILKYLVFLGVGGTLFYMAFRNTEFEKLMSDLRKARYEYVIASMIMGYLAFVSRGIRWKYLIEPMGFKTNTWHSIHAISLGYFTNALIPRAGELARCTSLNQMDKVPVNRLFGTVIVERIIDLIMMASLALLSLYLDYEKIVAFFDKTMTADTGADDDSGLWWKLTVASVIFGALLVFYFFRGKFREHPVYGKIKDFWLGIKEGLQSFRRIEHKVPFILHTLFIWTMYFLMSYIVVFALPSTSGIDPASGLFVVIVGALGIIAPSPGGIGTFHYFAMVGMGIVGIAKDDALSFATLVHTGQTVMTLLAGFIAMWMMYRIRRKRKAQNLTELSTDG
ncbi:MAG TPA: hypothetical protein DCG19_02065 [Cryomorphaceae bacterium]|nr:hypothetical protein [Owenweeksia sp.]HAD96157.1 hypothetical protein [Cryomorphaceae bacterium]